MNSYLSGAPEAFRLTAFTIGLEHVRREPRSRGTVGKETGGSRSVNVKKLTEG